MSSITRLVTIALLVAYVSRSLRGTFSHRTYTGAHAPPRRVPIYQALCNGMSIVKVAFPSFGLHVPTLLVSYS
jgi:hypothetical protein